MILGRIFAAAALVVAAPTCGAAPASADIIGMRDIDMRDVNAVGLKVARWQLARIGRFDQIAHVTTDTKDPRGWEQAAFWIGLSRFAERDADPALRKAVIAQGAANGWRMGDRLYFADDQAIAQTYLWAARHGAARAAIAPARAGLDRILADPPVVHLSFHRDASDRDNDSVACLKRWCWADALFMAPPLWVEMSRQTGDPRYADYAMREYFATVAFLYDPAERLFFRDSRFFDRRDDKGRKLFWSRGNGWVLSGMTGVLDALPARGAERVALLKLYREMAERVRSLQKPDGYWAPSLLAPEGAPAETSGTGFFVHALAWGVNNGTLDRATYAPVVRRGWAALLRAVAADGRLGWVQQASDRPDRVLESDTQFFGVGAFLLAASEIARLDAAGARNNKTEQGSNGND